MACIVTLDIYLPIVFNNNVSHFVMDYEGKLRSETENRPTLLSKSWLCFMTCGKMDLVQLYVRIENAPE